MGRFAMMALKSMARMACGLGLAIWLAGCAGTVDQSGNLLDPERLQEIEPGRQSREEVAEILGSPSAIGTFSDRKWYYISRQTSRLAFLERKILESHVVVITFDDDGIVESIHELNAEDRREIDMVSRTTPTAGQGMNVVQQLFGNIGRFNKPQ